MIRCTDITACGESSLAYSHRSSAGLRGTRPVDSQARQQNHQQPRGGESKPAKTSEGHNAILLLITSQTNDEYASVYIHERQHSLVTAVLVDFGFLVSREKQTVTGSDVYAILAGLSRAFFSSVVRQPPMYLVRWLRPLERNSYRPCSRARGQVLAANSGSREGRARQS